MRKIAITFAISIIFVIFASQSASAETYTVKKGDNLWDISKKHDIQVSDLMEINDLDTVILRPDQELYIYETYTIESGDTLSEIARNYSVTVEQLQDWNDLSSDLIITGDELIIHAMHDDLKEKAKKKQKQTAQKTTAKAAPKQEKQPAGKTLTVTATAYTAECKGCSGITYTGIDLNKDRQAKVIAVDPKVIPLGTRVHVEGYGEAIAGDIGGAIKGHKIDIHVPTKDEAYQWGVRTVNVTLLD